MEEKTSASFEAVATFSKSGDISMVVKRYRQHVAAMIRNAWVVHCADGGVPTEQKDHALLMIMLREDITMLCQKHPPLRNKVDLADARQVRVLTERLSISSDDLRRIVDKVGNSITAVTKEAEMERSSVPVALTA